MPICGEPKLTLPGLALRVLDQRLHVLRLHLRRDDQHLRRDDRLHDGCETVERIERQLRKERLVDGELVARHEQCVAVRCRAGRVAVADVAAPARLVHHEHLLAELGREMLRDHAREQIRAGARRGRRDDAQRLGRIRLLGAGPGAQEHGRDEDQDVAHETSCGRKDRSVISLAESRVPNAPRRSCKSIASSSPATSGRQS